MADFDLAKAGFPPLTVPCEKCKGSGLERFKNGHITEILPCEPCNGTGRRDNRDAVILAMMERLADLEKSCGAKCEDCGMRKPDVIVRVNMFEVEVNDNEVEYPMCQQCYYDHQGDV